MGCTLIPLDIVKAMGPRPWFYYELDDKGWPVVSEDVPFCRNAKAAGARIAWAPAIKCEHGTIHYVNESWYVAAVDGPMVAMAKEIDRRNLSGNLRPVAAGEPA
jgi:hypothetical protein